MSVQLIDEIADHSVEVVDLPGLLLDGGLKPVHLPLDAGGPAVACEVEQQGDGQIEQDLVPDGLADEAPCALGGGFDDLRFGRLPPLELPQSFGELTGLLAGEQ